MTLEQMYREDCDSLLLLADVFEQTNERYLSENNEELNRCEAKDMTTYYPPTCIHNLQALLTSSLIIQSVGLLEYYLRKIVDCRIEGRNQSVSPFDKTWKGGNVLKWIKYVMKNEIKTNFDCGTHLYSRLNDFYEIRHDLIHHGGYLSDTDRLLIVNRLTGISASDSNLPYYIEFSFCRSVINDVEAFFLEVDKALSK